MFHGSFLAVTQMASVHILLARIQIYGSLIAKDAGIWKFSPDMLWRMLRGGVLGDGSSGGKKTYKEN